MGIPDTDHCRMMRLSLAVLGVLLCLAWGQSLDSNQKLEALGTKAQTRREIETLHFVSKREAKKNEEKKGRNKRKNQREVSKTSKSKSKNKSKEKVKGKREEKTKTKIFQGRRKTGTKK